MRPRMPCLRRPRAPATESYDTDGIGRCMPDVPELPAPDDTDLSDYVERIESRARERAPTTVKATSVGTLLGAAAFGPIGGVAGAVAGSGIGYLDDEGYFGDDDAEDAADGEEADPDGDDDATADDDDADA